MKNLLWFTPLLLLPLLGSRKETITVTTQPTAPGPNADTPIMQPTPPAGVVPRTYTPAASTPTSGNTSYAANVFSNPGGANPISASISGNKEKKYKPLRSVKVTFSDGDYFVTSMNGELSDEEILAYYKPGRVLNIGSGEKDYFVEIAKVEILK